MTGWLAFLVLLSSVMAFLYLDKKCFLDRRIRRMVSAGFVFRGGTPEELILTRLVPLSRMLPRAFETKHIDRWGELEGAEFETIVGAASVSRGQSDSPWVFVAMRVDFDMPWFMVGPRQRRVRSGYQEIPIDDPAFARSCTLWTDDDADDHKILQSIIESEADIFVTEEPSVFSSLLSEKPGRHEQWAFCRGWLMYADHGRLQSQPMLDAVALVSEVAGRLHAATESMIFDPAHEKTAT